MPDTTRLFAQHVLHLLYYPVDGVVGHDPAFLGGGKIPSRFVLNGIGGRVAQVLGDVDAGLVVVHAFPMHVFRKESVCKGGLKLGRVGRALRGLHVALDEFFGVSLPVRMKAHADTEALAEVGHLLAQGAIAGVAVPDQDKLDAVTLEALANIEGLATKVSSLRLRVP